MRIDELGLYNTKGGEVIEVVAIRAHANLVVAVSSGDEIREYWIDGSSPTGIEDYTIVSKRSETNVYNLRLAFYPNGSVEAYNLDLDPEPTISTKLHSLGGCAQSALAIKDTRIWVRDGEGIDGN